MLNHPIIQLFSNADVERRSRKKYMAHQFRDQGVFGDFYKPTFGDGYVKNKKQP